MSEARQIVRTYEEFTSRLNELGFLLFGGVRETFLQLGMITDPAAWHRDDELDPWAWRRMLVERRDGAYARMLCGLNTLVSNEWYPAFVAAYTPEEDIETRYARGEIDATEKALYALFEERPTWAKHEITRALRDVPKGRVEHALARLQSEMAITVCGESQRLSWDLRPIGWPSAEYARVDCRMGEAAYERALSQSGATARARIRRQAARIYPEGDEAALDKLFSANLREEWSDDRQ